MADFASFHFDPGRPSGRGDEPNRSENALFYRALQQKELLDALTTRECLTIESLLATRADGHRRTILLAKQSIEWRVDAEAPLGTDKLLGDTARQRMDEFSLVPQYVDFYGQVPQVLHEARLRLVGEPDTRPYVDRLNDWWERWHGEVLRSPIDPQYRVSALQRDHHLLLREALDSIWTALKFDRDETQVLRLQVWVRWAPSPANRRFRLWCSSNGPISDLEAMPFHEIEWDSDSPIVRTFTEGRFCAFGAANGSRWRGGTVATPIWELSPRDELPLGVVVLQSRDRALVQDRLVRGRVQGPLRLQEWNRDIDIDARLIVKTLLRELGGAILTSRHETDPPREGG